MAHVTGAGANPHAALWEQAERSLIYRINAIHDTGWTVDRARDDLHWQGASARRFATRAERRHDDLQAHNDVLRDLLRLVRQAAAVTPAKAAAPQVETQPGKGRVTA
jgi:uncharacterized protein YukE